MEDNNNKEIDIKVNNLAKRLTKISIIDYKALL